MACTENIIKNMANEVTRNCQTQNINMEVEFVVFILELMLINPKYGKLFAKSINRTKLEYFVNVCVDKITRGEPSLHTLKMQFIMLRNYGDLNVLVDKNTAYAEKVLQPLLDEILDVDPEDNVQENEDSPSSTEKASAEEFKKLYRKIAIYILLASGLGSPAVVLNLQETMLALESVYEVGELYLWVTLPRHEKFAKLTQLLSLTAGIRLFNKDCLKGGDNIPDLPADLEEAAQACLATLTRCLIALMQRINMLTTAIQDCIAIDNETGNIQIAIPPDSDLTEKNYKKIFELLIFNRQYEVYARRLLSDIEEVLSCIKAQRTRVTKVLVQLHTAVRYKSAVPCDTVFPLFINLWEVWHKMQNTMFLVSTMNRLMNILNNIQEQMKIPRPIVDKMLVGKRVITDWERMRCGSLDYAMIPNESLLSTAQSLLVIPAKETLQYLGFCALCLCKGALVPSNITMGSVRVGKRRYGFCTQQMAAKFKKSPSRYINEALEFVRNNPQIITLLDLRQDVEAVRHKEELFQVVEPKVMMINKEVQTPVHAVEKYIEQDYSWNLYEWKKRACKLAAVTNYRTHSTQTVYSHLRAEIQCQTVEPRDKCQQTKKDAGVMTTKPDFFIWGLRGMKTDGQHSMDLRLPHEAEKLNPLSKKQWDATSTIISKSRKSMIRAKVPIVRIESHNLNSIE